MFTRGQPAMVIGRCSTLWDGSTIRPLTPEERRQLRSANRSLSDKRCLECSAFSYAPVPPELLWLFESQARAHAPARTPTRRSASTCARNMRTQHAHATCTMQHAHAICNMQHAHAHAYATGHMPHAHITSR
eukprot:126609-Prymnesium_polylepis.1